METSTKLLLVAACASIGIFLAIAVHLYQTRNCGMNGNVMVCVEGGYVEDGNIVFNMPF